MEFEKIIIWLMIKSLTRRTMPELRAFWETVANEIDKEKPKERHISPEQREKMIISFLI